MALIGPNLSLTNNNSNLFERVQSGAVCLSDVRPGHCPYQVDLQAGGEGGDPALPRPRRHHLWHHRPRHLRTAQPRQHQGLGPRHHHWAPGHGAAVSPGLGSSGTKLISNN